MVAPGTWRDEGGNVGTARVLGNALYVRQTRENLDKVRELLALCIAMRPAIHAYDVRDLVKQNEAEAATQPATTHPADRKVEALINAIKTTTGRDTWRDRGGKSSSVAYFEGSLYVTALPGVHDQIAELLRVMRAEVKHSSSR